MKLGLLGTGKMGLPLAEKLLAAGHEVAVWNRTPARAAPLAARGARLASSAADAATGVEALISVLADDGSTVAAVLDNPALFAALPRGAVHVSSATISVDLVKRLAAAHARHGHRLVSAPLLGRPEAIVNGSISIAVAGPADALAAVQPVFDAFASAKFVFGGDPTAANVVKLANNFFLIALINTRGEVMAFAGKQGIDPATFVKFLVDSGLPNRVTGNYGAMIAAERYVPAGASLTTGLKDVKLVLDAAEAAGVPMRTANLIYQQILVGISRGQATHDLASIAKVTREDAGLPPPG